MSSGAGEPACQISKGEAEVETGVASPLPVGGDGPTRHEAGPEASEINRATAVSREPNVTIATKIILSGGGPFMWKEAQKTCRNGCAMKLRG
jgi:hypothetical protein